MIVIELGALSTSSRKPKLKQKRSEEKRRQHWIGGVLNNDALRQHPGNPGVGLDRYFTLFFKSFPFLMLRNSVAQVYGTKQRRENCADEVKTWSLPEEQVNIFRVRGLQERRTKLLILARGKNHKGNYLAKLCEKRKKRKEMCVTGE